MAKNSKELETQPKASVKPTFPTMCHPSLQNGGLHSNNRGLGYQNYHKRKLEVLKFHILSQKQRQMKILITPT